MELTIRIYFDDIFNNGRKFQDYFRNEIFFERSFQNDEPGVEKWSLGMNVIDKDIGIFVTQNIHIDNIMDRFSVIESKIKSVPLSKWTDLKKAQISGHQDRLIERIPIKRTVSLITLSEHIHSTRHLVSRF